MSICIYDKTDKGREEIATRKYQVPPKLRTLLVVIDGRHSLETLLKNFAVLGLSKDNVDTLEQQGFITLVAGGPDQEPDTPTAAHVAPSARARMLARNAARQGRLANEGHDKPAAEPTAAMPSPVEQEAPAAVAARFRALYAFYNQTIKTNIGMRSLALQLKAEKAATLDDFRALRLVYLQAVLKAKGAAAALELRDRLDELLGGRPAPDEFILPEPSAAPARRGFNYFNLASEAVNVSEF